MVWMQPAEVVLGSAAADVRAVRMQCIEVAGRDLCNRLDQIGYWGREPQRRVKVDGFWIDRKEVTVGSFVAWLREQRGLQMRSSAIELDGEVVAGFGEMVLHDDAGFHARIGFEEGPMIDVTWQGAARYCADRGARLPSGTEWERTARGDGGRFPWGDGPPACRDAVLSRLGAACPGPERPEIAGRGERDRTREGVLDLVGNVSEWMREAGREPGTHEVRGGSYGASWVLARPAGRTFHPGRAVDVGFRCAAPPNRSIQDIGP
jgi:formylglycine-generating enzyme required for sulfatase activity